MTYAELTKIINSLNLNDLMNTNDRWEIGIQSNEAQLVARAIATADRLNGNALDFDFGGDGDNGEFLIWYIDMLIEAGLITVNMPKV